MNLAYGERGLKLEINISPQDILAKSKGGLIIEGGIISLNAFLACATYHECHCDGGQGLGG